MMLLRLTHNDLQIIHRAIVLPELPTAFEGFQLIHLSDLHFYQFSSRSYFDSLIEKVNALAPHVIAITGDIIHYGPKYVEMAGTYLSRLEAQEQKVAVLGNHDFLDSQKGALIHEMLQASGFSVLRNQNMRLEKQGPDQPIQRLWFAGVDDPKYGYSDLSQAMAGIPSPQESVILLSHNPLLWDTVACLPDGPIDLVLSGHTHAGHVYLPFLKPLYRLLFQIKYRYGLYVHNKTQLHVTSGVGSAAFYVYQRFCQFALPRYRYNTHPEVAVLTLTGHDPSLLQIEESAAKNTMLPDKDTKEPVSRSS